MALRAGLVLVKMLVVANRQAGRCISRTRGCTVVMAGSAVKAIAAITFDIGVGPETVTCSGSVAGIGT